MTKRTFTIGEEWLYLKIYTGPQTIEKLLGTTIRKMVDCFFEEQMIENFHFVRYMDDFHHLRLRFFKKKTITNFQLIEQLDKIFKPFIENGLIVNIVYDSYNREIERYGDLNMSEVESIFTYSSLTVIDSLTHIFENIDPNSRWLWGGKSVDSLMDDFSLSITNKIELLNDLYKAYSKEYVLDKLAIRSLNDKYRAFSRQIAVIWNDDNFKNVSSIPKTVDLQYKLAVKELLSRSSQGILKPKLNVVLKSLIHMHLNRLFSTSQRKSEFVLCYLLLKHLKSLNARNAEI